MSEPLVRELRLRCSREHAFVVFTTKVDTWWPPGHRKFEGSEVRLEARVGGRFFERTPKGEEWTLGEVLLCEPPHRLSYTWYPGALRLPTRVDLRFEDEGEETLVSVVHSEGMSQLGESWPHRVQLFERGWSAVLSALRDATDNQLSQPGSTGEG